MKCNHDTELTVLLQQKLIYVIAYWCFIFYSPTACNEELNGIGELKTPNYPGNYPINLDCVQIVRFNDTQRIQLTFLNFKTEAG